MSKPRKDAATKTKAASTDSGTVALTIDYSNGARKSFAAIPGPEDTGVLQVLEAAGAIKPGLVFKFTVTLISDRAGRKRGFIAAIDGVKADQKNQKWLLWINDQFIGDELATRGNFGSGTTVRTGDVVLFKLVSQ